MAMFNALLISFLLRLIYYANLRFLCKNVMAIKAADTPYILCLIAI